MRGLHFIWLVHVRLPTITLAVRSRERYSSTLQQSLYYLSIHIVRSPFRFVLFWESPPTERRSSVAEGDSKVGLRTM